ncbi:hypothetical protein RRG08_032861 [Elysia crispata]|uniref:Secreted protein n=1 Tax=Elysia crispata TaxID=231223 RepID=A0AAE1DHP5_9GAST|nr:hypothetical protein RRG08_032861 [Elysia crispata]
MTQPIQFVLWFSIFLENHADSTVVKCLVLSRQGDGCHIEAQIQTRDRACLDDNYGVIQFYLLQPRRAMMPLVLCFIGQGTQSA